MNLTHLSDQLETSFKKIHLERMHDVPVTNDRLQVKTTAFQSWQGDQLGILITPWFMNIVLLPVLHTETLSNNDESNEVDEVDEAEKEVSHWHDIKVGQEINHVLPSGRYTFVVGYEDDIGFYQSCSLFSPMFEFENQAAAELTAEAALAALFDRDHEDVASQHPSEEINKIWKGEATAPLQGESFADPQSDELRDNLRDDLDNTQSLEEKLQAPLSRRDFLRGQVLTRKSSDEKITK